MSDSNWRKIPSTRIALAVLVTTSAIALATLTVLYGTLESSKYEREASGKYSEYAAHTYGPKRNTCLKLPFLSQLDCIANAEREAREYERQEQDLVSQRITAVWTRLMGCAAIFGMLLSVLGVYLVYTTFKATREANSINSSTAKRQLRAYVGISASKISHFKLGDKIQYHIQFENFGQTPARELRLWAESTIKDEQRTATDSENDFSPFIGVLDPGNTVNIDPKMTAVATADLVAEIGTGTAIIKIWGAVQYIDVFGDVQRFKFDFNWTPLKADDRALSFNPTGNYTT